MIADVFLEGSTYAEPPARFEAGTPAIGEAIAFGAAIDYLQALGMDKVGSPHSSQPKACCLPSALAPPQRGGAAEGQGVLTGAPCGGKSPLDVLG